MSDLADLREEAAEALEQVWFMTTHPQLQPARIFTAVVHQEGKWHVATCPAIGTVSEGETEAEAEAMSV